MATIPTSPKSSIQVRETGTTGLEYLTAESDDADIVWDLGTFEVVEGSLETGKVAAYLSGRKLEGEWLLERTGQLWTLTNVSGTLKRGIPRNNSALVGLSESARKSGTHAAA